jgi:hypothetical protein
MALNIEPRYAECRNAECSDAECPYAECHAVCRNHLNVIRSVAMPNVVVLSVILLSVVMLSVVTLSTIVLNVVMLSAAAPDPVSSSSFSCRQTLGLCSSLSRFLIDRLH